MNIEFLLVSAPGAALLAAPVAARDALTTRSDDRSAYNSVPLPGFESTDNAIGISLVAGF